MSFLHSCILLLGILATGSAAPIPVDVTATPLRWSEAVLAKVGTRTQSPARKLLTRALGDGDEVGEPTGDTDEKSSTEEPEAAIPGAFVAVIFGVFGVLVIGRRSRR